MTRYISPVPAADQPVTPPGAVVLVLTRCISQLGTSMTAFGLDTWIFRQTGSYTTFALLALLTFVPNLVLAPFVGMIVDRSNKKALLLACEILSTLAVAFAFWQYVQSTLTPSRVAVVIFTMAMVGAVRWNAMGVAVSMLVPRGALGRVNGLQQAFGGAIEVCGPLVGALAIGTIGLDGTLAVDASSCLVAIAGLVQIDGGSLRRRDDRRHAIFGFWQEAAFGLRWIRGRADLSHLLLFIMGYNLAGSVFTVTFTPYLLTFTQPSWLGGTMALEGCGAFLVGALLARWKGRSNPERQVLAGALLFGVLMVLWGVTRAPWKICGLAFAAGTLTSLIVASLQTIWQSSVPIEIQGKVFAARRFVSYLLVPFAVLASIPFSQRFVAPVVSSSGIAIGLWARAREPLWE